MKHSVQCSMFSVQCSDFSVQCSVLSVQCSVFSVHCSVFSVQCSIFSVKCLLRCQCIVFYNVCQTTGIYIKKYFILYFLCFLFLAHDIVYRIFTFLRFKYKIERGGEVTGNFTINFLCISLKETKFYL